MSQVVNGSVLLNVVLSGLVKASFGIDYSQMSMQPGRNPESNAL